MAVGEAIVPRVQESLPDTSAPVGDDARSAGTIEIVDVTTCHADWRSGIVVLHPKLMAANHKARQNHGGCRQRATSASNGFEMVRPRHPEKYFSGH